MSSPCPLHVERSTGPAPFAALTPEWDALDTQLRPRTPFTSPLWNTLWWKHYRSQRALLRDDLFLHVVRDGTGQLVAVAPMMVTARPAVGPVRARVLHGFGADPNLTEMRGIVCRAGDDGPVFDALVRHFAQCPSAWDWIDWGVIRDASPARASLVVGGPVRWERTIVDYHLPLPATWEQFRGSRSRNVKESMRKGYNSLKRAGLAWELRVVHSPEACAPALETFFRLHADRARATATVVHDDVFERPRDRAFFEDYARAMAERRQLRMFELVVSGEVVAARVGFLLGDELYLYYSGYRARWGRFNVMTTLVAETLRWAIEQKMRVVNLSTGTDVSKVRWSPEATIYGVPIQVAANPRSQVLFHVYRSLRNLARGSRWNTRSSIASIASR